jgi:alpha-D-xyloside xylohydrolase
MSVPIDVIVQDWNYWEYDQWGNHDFDLKWYPNLKEIVDKIHEENSRIMISVWSKFYINTEHYKQINLLRSIY